jgi:hypothetical protein
VRDRCRPPDLTSLDSGFAGSKSIISRSLIGSSAVR